MSSCRFSIAAAQSSSTSGDVAGNVANHIMFAKLAASHGVSVIVFPELSLTGYIPEMAAENTIDFESSKLQSLQTAANEFNITILAGCPITSNERRPYIGTLIIAPDRPIDIYKKRFVHSDEDPFFVSGDDTVVIDRGNSRIGVAICADIHNDQHPADAAAAGANIYAAGVAITPSGIGRALNAMAGHAARHKLLAIMANYSERTGDFEIGGQSAVWDESGNLLAKAGEDNECLVIATADDGQWIGRVVAVNAIRQEN